MIRLMIFGILFPAVATVAFYVVGFVLTGANQDSGIGPVVICLFCIVPGLLVALIDWVAGKTSAPAVIATTLVTYGLTTLAMAWLLGPSPKALALGLIGAVPAAVCSWLLHRGPHNAAGDSRPRIPT
jgi:hypothetical protein